MDYGCRDQHISGEIGDVICFKRGNLFVFGEIIKLREVSCIVEISQSYANELKLDTKRTVVRHGNYKVIETKQIQATICENQLNSRYIPLYQ